MFARRKSFLWGHKSSILPFKGLLAEENWLLGKKLRVLPTRKISLLSCHPEYLYTPLSTIINPWLSLLSTKKDGGQERTGSLTACPGVCCHCFNTPGESLDFSGHLGSVQGMRHHSSVGESNMSIPSMSQAVGECPQPSVC